MQSVGSVMFHSAFAAVLVSSGLFVGCVNDDPEDKGTAGTSSGGTTAGTSGATAGTSSGGTDSATAGTSAGTGGSVAKAAACATVTKASGTSPVITDFEAMTAPGSGFTFESAGIMGGTYVYSDPLAPEPDVSTSKLSLDAGHDETSTKALVGKIHNATWGGGMGLWFGCTDATVYTGITFWARGVSPAGKVRVNLTVDNAVKVADGGTCPDAGPCTRPFADIEVTEEWQEFPLAWADFMAGDSAGTALPGGGDLVTGVDFGIPNDNMSRDLELAIDDVAFTKE